ncbi:hypothetical protein [Limnoglobus roseus]|uniref:Uncharacterized protein n=1 Tax=Limnoglobus roseus TaxID=2598579 RepID=A0A5C1AJV2_9BACT|nr:hypothetical protein [Limnoglobus roseus]QEL18955.1 hypothetical protein PX52LOC_06005 [Limnoglobus roseus]
MATQLRVYPAPEDTYDELEEGQEPSVRVRLGDLLPLVALAQRMNFMWVKDFLDDEVTITEDLHDVLQSFRGCRPTAG